MKRRLAVRVSCEWLLYPLFGSQFFVVVLTTEPVALDWTAHDFYIAVIVTVTLNAISGHRGQTLSGIKLNKLCAIAVDIRFSCSVILMIWCSARLNSAYLCCRSCVHFSRWRLGVYVLCLVMLQLLSVRATIQTDFSFQNEIDCQMFVQ